MNNYKSLIEKLADTHSHKCNCDGEKCFQKAKPILIGDVLEEMKAHHFPKDGSGCSPLLVDMLVLWKPCGFTRSVQQIAEDMEECKIHDHLGTPKKDCPSNKLKPSSEKLLSFLEKLF